MLTNRAAQRALVLSSPSASCYSTPLNIFSIRFMSAAGPNNRLNSLNQNGAKLPENRRPGQPVMMSRHASHRNSSFERVLNQPMDRRRMNQVQTGAQSGSKSNSDMVGGNALAVQSVFASDSTFMLMKKLMVYKLMGSNLFINNALGMMTTCYTVLGIPVTNTAINKSVGSLFTSGETIQTLMEDIADLQKRNINGIAGYTAEGLQSMDEKKINEFQDFMLDSIKAQTEGDREGHFALKFTALVTMDIMRDWNRVQSIFLYDILALDKFDELTFEQFEQNLSKQNVNLTQEEKIALFDHIKIDDSNNLSRVDRYANGHLLQLNPESYKIEAILKKVCTDLGFSEDDLQIFQKFSERVNYIIGYSNDVDCKLYIDAEQSFLQIAIESFAQQMTQKHNQNDKVIILNGFQCYLKRMRTLLSDEIAASQALGFNIGVKLIRGAYMNEERSIAAEEGVESPVWDTIDQTHSCYNDCMKMVLDNLDDNGMILIGSHNKESIEKAKAIIVENGIQDSKVHFGQLKGFSDQITNMLAQENYKVYKYLPYGPTETVMPYLIRRGQESRQVLREQEFQNHFLKNELKNRLTPFGRMKTQSS